MLTFALVNLTKRIYPEIRYQKVKPWSNLAQQELRASKLKEKRLTKRKPPTATQLVRTSKLIARDARKRGELESAKSHNAKSPPAPATANWLRGRGAMELQLQWRTRRACEVPVFVAQAARPHHSTRSARAQFIPPPPTHTHTHTLPRRKQSPPSADLVPRLLGNNLRAGGCELISSRDSVRRGVKIAVGRSHGKGQQGSAHLVLAAAAWEWGRRPRIDAEAAETDLRAQL